MLIVDQTVKCNEKCFFCWRSNVDLVREKTAEAKGVLDLPLDDLKEIVDQASVVYTMRTFNVCGPMGDPTLVKDLPERGFYAAEKGFGKRMINTNGVALDYFDPEAILRAYNEIKVSLDTVDHQKYIDIHGRDHLDRVLKNISDYARVKREKGIPGNFGVKVTLNDKNEDERDDIAAWAEKHQVPVVWKRIHSFMDFLPEYGDDYGAKHCEQPYGTINFNFRGELTTCCINYSLSPTFGTLKDGSLKELWEGEEFEKWRNERLSGICKDCTGLGWNRPVLKQEGKYTVETGI